MRRETGIRKGKMDGEKEKDGEKKREKSHTDNVTPKVQVLCECISFIPATSPKAMVTSAVITMPIQLYTFYLPYCTKKHRYAKRSSRALRDIKEPGGRADSREGK